MRLVSAYIAIGREASLNLILLLDLSKTLFFNAEQTGFRNIRLMLLHLFKEY